MKLGAEKKSKVVVLALLLVLASALLWNDVDGSAPAATPASTTIVPAATTLPSIRLDPTLHLELLAQLRAREYTGTGRDLFHFGSLPSLAQQGAGPHSPFTQPAKEAMPPAGPAMPSGPPPPPPIPLKFYGFAQPSGQAEKIFLQMGDDNFVVSQGDVVAHRYQIENIGKVSIRVRDLQTQSVQELPLQQG
ncbi:MAG TPA: hypothetical protein VN690_01145 [Terriglobales bacterium]|nr:hypothetical protein [Terriglobales bacterium]